MATFEQLVDENETVLASANPFTYLKVEGDYEWTNPNTLDLEGDGYFFVNRNHGRIHFIVKPNHEITLRIKATGLGVFDLVDQYPQTAFEMEAWNPLTPDWNSSLDVTLRGGSMLALAATDKGDQGVWDKVGTTFHIESVQRGIIQPQDRGTDATDVISLGQNLSGFGLMLSLTAPYGDYSEQGTYTLIWDAHGGDYQISIIDIVNLGENGGFASGQTNFETTNVDLVFSDSPIGRDAYSELEYLDDYRTGYDADGRAWSVQLGRREDGKWFVVVDGAVDSKPFNSRFDASLAANERAKALALRTTLIEPAKGLFDGLGVVALIVVGSLLAAYLFGRSS